MPVTQYTYTVGLQTISTVLTANIWLVVFFWYPLKHIPFDFFLSQSDFVITKQQEKAN
jgi:hypothetical protein